MRTRQLLLASGIGVLVMAGLSAPVEANETKSYTYDALGRVVLVVSSGTVNAGDTNSICFDRGGNRKTYRSSDTGVAATCVVTGSSLASSLLLEGDTSSESLEWNGFDEFEDSSVGEAPSLTQIDDASEPAAEPEAETQGASDSASAAAPQAGE